METQRLSKGSSEMAVVELLTLRLSRWLCRNDRKPGGSPRLGRLGTRSAKKAPASTSHPRRCRVWSWRRPPAPLIHLKPPILPLRTFFAPLSSPVSSLLPPFQGPNPQSKQNKNKIKKFKTPFRSTHIIFSQIISKGRRHFLYIYYC